MPPLSALSGRVSGYGEVAGGAGGGRPKPGQRDQGPRYHHPLLTHGACMHHQVICVGLMMVLMMLIVMVLVCV
jgi:hypothetical protein